MIRVLTIGGSDSGGGAGIEADIKTITALGGYALTAITAVTVQDTRAVHQIVAIEPAVVARAIEVGLADIGADAIKIGMLGSAAMVSAVADALASWVTRVPIVLDPVLAASTGVSLLAADAVTALRTRLMPLVTLVTPNLAEAALLSGMEVTDVVQAQAAALALAGPGSILVKGGHLTGATLVDVLAQNGAVTCFSGERIITRAGHGAGHGTGCTLASAIAVGLAEGLDLITAIERGRGFLRAALTAAPGFGAGVGPLGHAAVEIRPDRIM
ncbi:MAG TPA: bifunctional hydroxymethylpyrimidine kinase/phosphomethylpyrimidine kinase [Acidiphilium sp.]|nr:MAG: bifunctional hydroxymethylpyrimidine kinase/phosphomethylpyrimidine kinase [Acidiphilium sp. 21-60-14]OYV90892.1 MAG: bifunctional hydroxymethylpyrimidine kinase/phosphomethylpyrimidine kinase [Acidiphilium sp. 37-60-79]OZB39611.1 MAG: bifunctional hydroxymethylpyrimidine kinase/phosphomethylpyrimidine kinase [Acidiphilium sp. 34-60-192]HQT88304.1 bifunctional hydroxymethylpyrimidine kinase/phosphomethylpyrimidine kinase [Acidiphilium sp.]HQU23353.1 bifunctional hydroxymethylpyrimidine 